MSGLRITLGNRRPRLVGKLRYLCRADKCGKDQETILKLKNAANTILLHITSLGLDNKPEQWENLAVYRRGAHLVKELTGETWGGERAVD